MFLTSRAPFGLDLQTDGVFFSKYSSRRVIILYKKIRYLSPLSKFSVITCNLGH
mgnify:CR=1 FL=1